MSDLGISIVDGCFDLSLSADGSTLKRDEGLETAVIISLFTDARIATGELASGETDRRGWWGDTQAEITGDEYGSKLWTLERSILTNETAQIAQVRARQCLQWMIDDGVASAVTVATSIQGSELKFQIDIQRPTDTGSNRFSFFWDGQERIR